MSLEHPDVPESKKSIKELRNYQQDIVIFHIRIVSNVKGITELENIPISDPS